LRAFIILSLIVVISIIGYINYSLSQSDFNDQISQSEVLSRPISSEKHESTEMGRILRMTQEPGITYVDVQIDSDTVKTIASSSLRYASIFDKPRIGDSVRWYAQTTDNNVYSRFLNTTFDEVTYVQFEPILPNHGKVTKVVEYPHEIEVYVSTEALLEQKKDLILKARRLDMAGDTMLFKGETISWINKKLLVSGNASHRLPVVAVEAIQPLTSNKKTLL
jgi:hypothetical protein